MLYGIADTLSRRNVEVLKSTLWRYRDSWLPVMYLSCCDLLRRASWIHSSEKFEGFSFPRSHDSAGSIHCTFHRAVSCHSYLTNRHDALSAAVL